MKNDPVRAAVLAYLRELPVSEREKLLEEFLPHSAITPMAKPRPLMSVGEASEYLRCSRTTLWRMEQTGDLRAVWVRRRKLFRAEDLIRVLREDP